MKRRRRKLAVRVQKKDSQEFFQNKISRARGRSRTASITKFATRPKQRLREKCREIKMNIVIGFQPTLRYPLEVSLSNKIVGVSLSLSI